MMLAALGPGTLDLATATAAAFAHVGAMPMVDRWRMVRAAEPRPVAPTPRLS
jgi:hypothetical protein